MEPELLQSLAVGGIVAGAVGYLARRWYRTLAAARAARGKGGCGGGCCPH